MFDAVEINAIALSSSPASTYARWADSVPDDFLFSVKLARAITLQMVAIAPPGALDRQR